jgi:hypothetical protein
MNIRNFLKKIGPHVTPVAGLIISSLALFQQKSDSSKADAYQQEKREHWALKYRNSKSESNLLAKDSSTNSEITTVKTVDTSSRSQTGNSSTQTSTPQTGNSSTTQTSTQNVPTNSGSESTDIKSNSFDFLTNLLDQFQEFLATLAVDQTLALVNLFILFIVSFVLLNIFIILVSDYLIESFKLEARYPKLTTFLIFRKTINKGYLYIYIIYVTIVLVYGLVINTLIVFNLI